MCFLKDSKIFSFKNIFIQSLHNAFFPLLLNNEATDIEKPNGIYMAFITEGFLEVAAES